MDEARARAGAGAPSGSVVWANHQSAGRGRVAHRLWRACRGESLLFTLILRYESAAAFPAALPLRAALALADAIAALFPPLAPAIAVKWPNDLMLNGKKAAGILTESDGTSVFIGMGVNVLQEAPETLDEGGRATSILAELRNAQSPVVPNVEALLEETLPRLKAELSGGAAQADDRDWRPRLESILHMKGREVLFLNGRADGACEVRGALVGVSDEGFLLMRDGATGTQRAFVAGELSLRQA
jgi:BirA family biotin operon repressor/biotin-[acetyl-CoA-carboxylase] ligase